VYSTRSAPFFCIHQPLHPPLPGFCSYRPTFRCRPRSPRSPLPTPIDDTAALDLSEGAVLVARVNDDSDTSMVSVSSGAGASTSDGDLGKSDPWTTLDPDEPDHGRSSVSTSRSSGLSVATRTHQPGRSNDGLVAARRCV